MSYSKKGRSFSGRMRRGHKKWKAARKSDEFWRRHGIDRAERDDRVVSARMASLGYSELHRILRLVGRSAVVIPGRGASSRIRDMQLRNDEGQLHIRLSDGTVLQEKLEDLRWLGGNSIYERCYLSCGKSSGYWFMTVEGE